MRLTISDLTDKYLWHKERETPHNLFDQPHQVASVFKQHVIHETWHLKFAIYVCLSYFCSLLEQGALWLSIHTPGSDLWEN